MIETNRLPSFGINVRCNFVANFESAGLHRAKVNNCLAALLRIKNRERVVLRSEDTRIANLTAALRVKRSR